MALDLGTMVGLVGIIAGYVFYRIGQRSKSPCWAVRTTALIRGHRAKLDGLQVQFAGHSVDNLSVSSIVFWNEGRETIDRQDLQTLDPLRVRSTGKSAILDARIVLSNTIASEVRVMPSAFSDSSYLLEFDFLDRAQGALIQVVHTGTSLGDVEVVGSIKGAEKLRRRDWKVFRYADYSDALYTTSKLLGRIVIISAILESLFAFVLGRLGRITWTPNDTRSLALACGAFFIAMLIDLGIQVLWNRSRIPGGLQSMPWIYNEAIN